MLTEQLEKFSSLNPSLLKDYAGKVLKFSDGELFFKVDEKADRAYFILSGQVEIELKSEGDSTRITELGPRQLFGELGVLKNKGRLGTARAKGPVTVLAFEAEAFKKMHEAAPEVQQLVAAMENVYQVKHQGIVNIYHGQFLEMPAISAIYQLDNGNSIISSKVIGKPIFTMTYNDIKNSNTLRYRHGRTTRRELVIKDNKLLGVISVGEWEELDEICDAILNQKQFNPEQLKLFATEGVLNIPRKKTTISADERNELVCLCMRITKGSIFDAIAEGATKSDDVSKTTGAGTVCGNCRPKISEILGLSAWTPVNVIEVISHHPDICSFKLFSKELLSMEYKPGQHIVIQALIDNHYINRNYTLTSVSGHDQFIEITVKREPKGYFSRWLFDNAQKTSFLRISAPQGEFILNDDNVPVVCFAGGIGITPALAFARCINFKKQYTRIHIDYSARRQQDFILIDEWKHMSTQNPLISVNLRNTHEQGVLQQEHVAQLLQEFPNANFYICGPKPFEQAIISYLNHLNVPQSNIKTEEFVHAGSPLNESIEM